MYYYHHPYQYSETYIIFLLALAIPQFLPFQPAALLY